MCPPAALLAVVCAMTFPATSVAQSALQGSGFSLQLNEKEMVLAHPGNQGMINYAEWDTGYQRLLDRNMPYLMLQNDALSAEPIMELRLTIGDERFNFGNTAKMFHGLYTMIGLSIPNAVVNSHVEDAGNELVVNFGSQGILPGSSVCFRINLDVDADHSDFFPYPDFRTVLFDMNGYNVYDGNVYDPSDEDNAMALVTFGAGESMFEAGPVAFQDTPVGGVEQFFSNGALRPYGVMEKASTFIVSAEIETEVVPEPSSIALVLLGCAGGAVLAARRRRRKFGENEDIA